MLGDRRLFDDMARVASGAAEAFGGIRSRMEGELREHIERLMLRMKVVTREEFEVVEALAQKARAEQEVLAERLAVLEARLSAKAPSVRGKPPTGTDAKPARRRRGAA
jgi:BMFP domain-containing protein YqiC